MRGGKKRVRDERWSVIMGGDREWDIYYGVLRRKDLTNKKKEGSWWGLASRFLCRV